MPKVRFGEPELISNYKEYRIEGIKVYISNILEPVENIIHIKYSSLLGIFKNLDVYGFKIF